MRIKLNYKLQNVIPVASMSDIAFLLLIFMLLASILAPTPPLAILPPPVIPASEIKNEVGVRIYLKADGTMSLNDQIGSWQQVGEVLKHMTLASEQKIYLYADGQTKFDKIKYILDALQAQDLAQVTLICQQVLDE